MATDQKKKEKEQFFEDLSRLDQLIDDADETSDFSFKKSHPTSPQPVLVTESSSTTPNAALVSLVSSQTSAAQRRRKEAKDHSLSMPILQPADTELEPVRPSSSPLRHSKKHKPERLKRSKSHLDNPDPLWRKGDPVLKPVSEERRVFDGFIFCQSNAKMVLAL
jgi:hypothetical protein